MISTDFRRRADSPPVGAELPPGGAAVLTAGAEAPAGSQGAAAGSVGRRERKKHATRQALHEAAITLVEARGLGGVTIEAITESVDVAPRTFFNYYSSKEDAVLGPFGDHQEIAADLGCRLEAGAQPLDALEAALLADAMLYDSSSEALMRRTRVLRSEPLLLAAAAARYEVLTARLMEVVAGHGPAGGGGDGDLYPELVVRVAVAALRTSMIHWAETPTRPLDAVVEQSFELVRGGLAPVRPKPGRGRTTPAAARQVGVAE